MRIDGPAFRGRLLGHRIDPLRSVLTSPPADTWIDIVTRVLGVHDFRVLSRHQVVGDLAVLNGTIAQTLLWQSPAFAEYGYRYRPDEVRQEPALDQVFGDVCVSLDSAENRSNFAEDEAAALQGFIDESADNGQTVVVFFRGLDLSETGGVWRSTMRRSTIAGQHDGWHQLGLEALSYLVLTATLVYLEFAPHLDWDHANYLDWLDPDAGIVPLEAPNSGETEVASANAVRLQTTDGADGPSWSELNASRVVKVRIRPRTRNYPHDPSADQPLRRPIGRRSCI